LRPWYTGFACKDAARADGLADDGEIPDGMRTCGGSTRVLWRVD
jgi:hypothetical protein